MGNVSRKTLAVAKATTRAGNFDFNDFAPMKSTIGRQNILHNDEKANTKCGVMERIGTSSSIKKDTKVIQKTRFAFR